MAPDAGGGECRLPHLGSEYGKAVSRIGRRRRGLLQRWASYVKTGHGGNKQLKGILAAELEYRRNFSFSILQTFARVTPSAEVLAAERIHKAKLGTLAHGLNDN